MLAAGLVFRGGQWVSEPLQGPYSVLTNLQYSHGPQILLAFHQELCKASVDYEVFLSNLP